MPCKPTLGIGGSPRRMPGRPYPSAAMPPTVRSTVRSSTWVAPTISSSSFCQNQEVPLACPELEIEQGLQLAGAAGSALRLSRRLPPESSPSPNGQARSSVRPARMEIQSPVSGAGPYACSAVEKPSATSPSRRLLSSARHLVSPTRSANEGQTTSPFTRTPGMSTDVAGQCFSGNREVLVGSDFSEQSAQPVSNQSLSALPSADPEQEIPCNPEQAIVVGSSSEPQSPTPRLSSGLNSLRRIQNTNETLQRAIGCGRRTTERVTFKEDEKTSFDDPDAEEDHVPTGVDDIDGLCIGQVWDSLEPAESCGQAQSGGVDVAAASSSTKSISSRPHRLVGRSPLNSGGCCGGASASSSGGGTAAARQAAGKRRLVGEAAGSTDTPNPIAFSSARRERSDSPERMRCGARTCRSTIASDVSNSDEENEACEIISFHNQRNSFAEYIAAGAPPHEDRPEPRRQTCPGSTLSRRLTSNTFLNLAEKGLTFASQLQADFS